MPADVIDGPYGLRRHTGRRNLTEADLDGIVGNFSNLKTDRDLELDGDLPDEEADDTVRLYCSRFPPYITEKSPADSDVDEGFETIGEAYDVQFEPMEYCDDDDRYWIETLLPSLDKNELIRLGKLVSGYNKRLRGHTHSPLEDLEMRVYADHPDGQNPVLIHIYSPDEHGVVYAVYDPTDLSEDGDKANFGYGYLKLQGVQSEDTESAVIHYL